MNNRLPFTFQAHTGSPVGYSEVAALCFRSLLEIGVEVHYQSLAEDYIYEQGCYDMVVNAMRNIEPERNMPWVTLSTAPMFWNNGGNYKIGWTMIETDKINERWVRACNSLNELWVPTQMQVDIFKESGVTIPIYVVPCGYDQTRFSKEFLPAIYHGEHSFRFIGIGWWQQRKRWDLLTTAFDEEFANNKEVGIIYKTMTGQGEGDCIKQIQGWVGHRLDDQLALVEGAFPWWELAMMIRSSQCFVLPTAGEGWGCPPVQALACGLPVIVPDCMGTGETLKDDKGVPYPGVYLLPCHKEATEVGHDYYNGSNWWVIEDGVLRKAMREVYENYDIWKAQAAIGADMVKEQRSGLAMARAVKSRLEDIYSKGLF